jgi:hypothetical protein
MKQLETAGNKQDDDLKSLGRITHTGSSPLPGTKEHQTSKSTGFSIWFA